MQKAFPNDKPLVNFRLEKSTYWKVVAEAKDKGVSLASLAREYFLLGRATKAKMFVERNKHQEESTVAGSELKVEVAVVE